MDNFTKLVKEKILQKYNSVRSFAIKTDIPYTTVSAALKNGVGRSSFSTVCKICKELEIDIDEVCNLIYSPDLIEKIHKYEALDDEGKNKIDSIIKKF